MRREIGRLRVVLEQLKDVSAERNAIALGKTIETLHRDQGSADADAAMIASLARLKGVGPERRIGARARGLLAQLQQPT